MRVHDTDYWASAETGVTSSTEPHLNEGDAEGQVLHPAAQGLEGRVGRAGPVLGHLVVQEAVVDELHLL